MAVEVTSFGGHATEHPEDTVGVASEDANEAVGGGVGVGGIVLRYRRHAAPDACDAVGAHRGDGVVVERALLRAPVDVIHATAVFGVCRGDVPRGGAVGAAGLGGEAATQVGGAQQRGGEGVEDGRRRVRAAVDVIRAAEVVLRGGG